MFCKYLCTTSLRKKLVSFKRIQLVPFSLPSWLRKIHFVLYKYKMRGNSIWNIWIWIKWEAKLRNPNFPLSMGFNSLCIRVFTWALRTDGCRILTCWWDGGQLHILQGKRKQRGDMQAPRCPLLSCRKPSSAEEVSNS